MDSSIAKYDAQHNLKWIRHTGGNFAPFVQSGTNATHGVTTDRSDNIIATGRYIGSAAFDSVILPTGGESTSAFLAKYDTDGNVLWAKAGTGPFVCIGWDVSTDDADNIYVSGAFAHNTFNGSLTFDSTTVTTVGGTDIFVAKFDPAGNLVWLRRAGSPNHDGGDHGTAISTDGAGNSVVSGIFRGTATFDATTSLTSAGGTNAFAAKYDTDGNVLWARLVGGAVRSQAGGVAVDSRGGAFVSGWFQGTADFGGAQLTSVGVSDIFVTRYDASGNLVWAEQAGGANATFGEATGRIAVDSVTGNVVVTGSFIGTADFGGTVLTGAGGQDIFVAAYDPDGTVMWARRAGSNLSSESGTSVALGNAGEVFATGVFTGTADFGDGSLVSAGDQDIFIATLGPDTPPITLDIKPGSDSNVINLNSKGVIPVAILSTGSFDASSVLDSSIAFGPAGAQTVHGGHIQDVSGDGILDLVLHFKTQETGIACGDTSATLTGETSSGQAIEISDTIETVGC